MASIAPYQFRHPDAGIAFDIDGALAAQTRQAIVEMVATDRVLVAVSHIPFPEFGHQVVKSRANRLVTTAL
ncbi:MAG: hypothetical protein KTR32_14160 [Granulosicoccus sp.]|nr:hypothetical protein [Granulosicoccus sp.]